MDAMINQEQTEQPLYNHLDDGYDSTDEFDIEITDFKNGSPSTHIYTVPYKPTHCNEKRLLCYTVINNSVCEYGSKCAYAHSMNDQIIDEDRKFIYQILLDKNLMNFFSITNPKTNEIYKHLLFLTNICSYCIKKTCTGGYNCKHGVCDSSLKLCKNDLYTGECINKTFDINVHPDIINKMHTDGFIFCDHYRGCINGHHLSDRGLIPYYKYVHQQESSKKNKYHSVRYIDLDPLTRIFRYKDNITNDYANDSESSTDEEVNSWFQKNSDSEED